MKKPTVVLCMLHPGNRAMPTGPEWRAEIHRAGSRAMVPGTHANKGAAAFAALCLLAGNVSSLPRKNASAPEMTAALRALGWAVQLEADGPAAGEECLHCFGTGKSPQCMRVGEHEKHSNPDGDDWMSGDEGEWMAEAGDEGEEDEEDSKAGKGKQEDGAGNAKAKGKPAAATLTDRDHRQNIKRALATVPKTAKRAPLPSRTAPAARRTIRGGV